MLAEFDMKDMLNSKSLIFTPTLENQLVFNAVNGFKRTRKDLEAQ